MVFEKLMSLTKRDLLAMLGKVVKTAALASVLSCVPKSRELKFVEDSLEHLDALWEGCGLASPLSMTLEDIARINLSSGQVYRFRPHTLSYYCVKKAQIEGAIPRRGNVIIHVDIHQDFYHPLWEVEQIQKVADLMEESSLQREEKLDLLKHLSVYPLHIENFIVHLLVDGSVSRVYHLKPAVENMEMPCAPGEWRFRISDSLVTSTTLVDASQSYLENEIKARFTEHWIEEPETQLRELYEQFIRLPYETALLEENFADKNVILDIDYDYFACIAEPYVHRHSKEEIRKSVQNVLRRLAELGVQPKLICQAESPKYTPKELVQVIAEAVQENLQRYWFMHSLSSYDFTGYNQ